MITYMVFNLSFADNAILSCLFLFFLIIDLNLLLPTFMAQIFNHTPELAIPVGTTTNKTNSKIETQSEIVESKIIKSLI